MGPARSVCALWLAAAGLVGCGEIERGEGVFPTQAAANFDGGARDAGAGTDDAGMTSAELEDPVGTWALFVEDRKCLSAVGATVENIIWSWYRLDIHEAQATGADGQRVLRQSVTLCSQELSPLIGGLKTIIPPELVSALATQPWSAFLQGSAAGDGYVTSDFTDVWGGTGIEPDEPVPTEPDDPRIIDLDGDGEPGVTFVVGNSAGGEACRVFVVQRTRLQLTGAVVDSARLEGAVQSTVDKAVLGSTSPLCNSNNEFVASPTPSRFVLVRVDAESGGLDLDLDSSGAVSCAEIVAGEQVLTGSGMVARSEPDNAVCQ